MLFLLSFFPKKKAAVDFVAILIAVVLIYLYLIVKMTSWVHGLAELLDNVLRMGHLRNGSDMEKEDNKLEHCSPLLLPGSFPEAKTDGDDDDVGGGSSGSGGNKKHPFYTLPPELIHYIASYLSAAERACLTLTSKDFLSIFGRRCLELQDGKRIRPNGIVVDAQDRWELLQLLERDLRWHFLCYHCKCLHIKLPTECTYESLLPPTSVCISRTNRFYRGVWGWSLGFERAYGIMTEKRNRWSYGPRVEDLAYQRSITMSKASLRAAREGSLAVTMRAAMYLDENQIECDEKVSATIFCGNLHLNIQVTFFVEHGARSLEEYVVNERCANHGLDILGDLDRLRALGLYEKICLDCLAFTNFRIHESPIRRGQDEVQICMMFNLGDCREQFGERWRKACGRGSN